MKQIIEWWSADRLFSCAYVSAMSTPSLETLKNMYVY